MCDHLLMPREVTFRIREISADEWELWRDVRLQALAESPSAFESTYEQWESAPESRWRARLNSVEFNLIAEDVSDGSAPLGIASGVRKADGTAELVSMWVAPRARGRGAADALIERVTDWGRKVAAELWLALTPGNDRAMAVYQRHGFELSERMGAETAGGLGRELLMVKPLA